MWKYKIQSKLCNSPWVVKAKYRVNYQGSLDYDHQLIYQTMDVSHSKRKLLVSPWRLNSRCSLSLPSLFECKHGGCSPVIVSDLTHSAHIIAASDRVGLCMVVKQQTSEEEKHMPQHLFSTALTVCCGQGSTLNLVQSKTTSSGIY